jgi:hypothetical protein
LGPIQRVDVLIALEPFRIEFAQEFRFVHLCHVKQRQVSRRKLARAGRVYDNQLIHNLSSVNVTLRTLRALFGALNSSEIFSIKHTVFAVCSSKTFPINLLVKYLAVQFDSVSAFG